MALEHMDGLILEKEKALLFLYGTENDKYIWTLYLLDYMVFIDKYSLVFNMHKVWRYF